MKNNLAEIINTILKTSYSASELAIKESVSEWDSLKNIEIVFAVEEEFGVSIDETELSAIAGLDSLLDLVAKKSAT